MSKIVRELTLSDLPYVREMDTAAGFYLEQWLDSFGFGWGIFKNNELIGYCSIGGADDVNREIIEDPDYTYDAMLLSDVYVKPEYRRQGVCTQMLGEVLSKLEDQESTVYCCPSYSNLGRVYEAAGFISMDEEYVCMKFVRKSKNESNTGSQTIS